MIAKDCSRLIFIHDLDFVKYTLYYLSATPGNLTTQQQMLHKYDSELHQVNYMYEVTIKSKELYKAIVSNELRTSADVVKQTLNNTRNKGKRD